MAEEKSASIFSKEWFEETSLLVLPLLVVGLALKVMHGKFARWGENLHGHRYDGSHKHEYPYSHDNYEPSKPEVQEKKAA